MAIKLLILSLIAANSAFGFYHNSQLTYEVYKLRDQLKVQKKLFTKKESELFRKIENDSENLVSNDFKMERYIQGRVLFWLRVYAFYDKNTLMLHNKDNPNQIYDIYKITGTETTDPLMNRLYNLYVQNYLSRKLKKSNPVEFRVQSGRKEQFLEGLGRYAKDYKFHKKMISAFELPEDILALGFLESNYNPQASSAAQAAGIWQIMPFLAKTLMPYSQDNDTRYNPYISTLAAFHLLKQNKKILKRWDLAITAYNNGMKAILQTRKKLNIPLKNLSFRKLVTHNSNISMGFASTNFFSAFTSLVYILAYKHHFADWRPSTDSESYQLAVVNCRPPSDFKPKQTLNPQLLRPIREGDVIVTTNRKKASFLKYLSNKQLRRKYPVNWKKWFKKDC